MKLVLIDEEENEYVVTSDLIDYNLNDAEDVANLIADIQSCVNEAYADEVGLFL